MYLKDFENEFSDDLILKQTFQDNASLEIELVIFLGLSSMSKNHSYICDYALFVNQLNRGLLPPYCVFFITNSENSCLELVLPDNITCFFLRIDLETFCTRVRQMVNKNDSVINETRYIKMKSAWQKALKGEDIDLSEAFYPFKPFVSCILIESESSPFSASKLCHLLELFSDFFNEQNIFPYKGRIIILYSQNTRPDSELDLCYSELNKLLDDYGLHAAVSNACRHIDMYPTLYRTASASLRLSRTLPASQKYSRIIQYNEFSMYYIIDLCVKEFIRMHHHKDIIYLISPSVIELYRYDQKHNSDLLNTLFHYLLHGRNVTDTASVLYMHRNTVFNKINKINSIIHLPLENGMIQFSLLMSCFIVNYYEKYLKENLER